MFSGKTTYLINYVTNYSKKYIVFSPSLDTRYGTNRIQTHDGKHITSVSIDNLDEIIVASSEVDLVAFDEIQFFDLKLIDILDTLSQQGKEILLVGLEKDYLDNDFGLLPLLNLPEQNITRLTGSCNECNKPSTKTFRSHQSSEKIELGSNDKYKSLCSTCYDKFTQHEY